MRSFKVAFPMILIFSAIAAVTSDLYLPSVPAIAVAFHTSLNMVQLTIAVFVLGICLARICFGVVSDAFGRKNPIIVGLIIAVVGGLLTVFASNIWVLLLGRFLQGLGVGGSNILARVLLRDYLEGPKLATYSSYFSMGSISLIAMAPMAGGYLQHYYGFRASLIVLTLLALFAFLIAIFILQETNQFKHRDHLKWNVIKSHVEILFRHEVYLTYAALLFLGFAAFYAWITSGSVLIQHSLGFSPIFYGWMAFCVGVFYFLGALANSHFVKRLGTFFMMQTGIVIWLFGSITLIGVLLYHLFNIWVLMIPVFAVFFGLALTIPNSFAEGAMPFPEFAGFAIAILGSIQFFGGVLSSVYISYMPEYNQLPLGIMLVVCASLAIIILKSVIEPKLAEQSPSK